MLDAIRMSSDVAALHASLVGVMKSIFDVNCYVEITTEGLGPREYRMTRAWGEGALEAVPNRSPWRWEGVPVRTGGIIAEILARDAPSVAAGFTFPPDDPAFPELGEYHAVAATPGALGQGHHWVFIFHRCPDAFGVETLEDLILRVTLIGSALKNLATAIELDAAYRQLTAATDFIRAEVARIAAIQKSLLPPEEVSIPGLEVAAWSETFEQAGGDLFDYANLPDGRWCCLVGDASGHGPSAAVVAAMLHTVLHTGAAAGAGEMLGLANRHLASSRIEQCFATAVLAVWDSGDRRLTYARAGHNYPLLRRERGGAIIELSGAGGLPLGIYAHSTYNEDNLRLDRGDTLVLFSDGIIEAENSQREPYDLDRLPAVIAGTRGTARELVSAIRKSVGMHQAECRPGDDQTVMVLRAV
jgi:sigma-B regulation protein RsbU (phosphoserine phosphatase)